MKKRNKVLSFCIAVVMVCTLMFGCAPKDYKNDTNTKVPFSWDNATVYFALTDRFLDGNKENNHSYGRELDASGKENADYKKQPSTYHGGDIKGITKKINEGYFNDLGVNAIWITSPFEQIHGYYAGQGFRFYSYHGYYVLDYSNIDGNVGTKEEFKEFVDTAHKHGIRVVMDIVVNHAGYPTLKDMDEYGFGKLKDGWKDFYYGDPSNVTNDTYFSYMDKSDAASWGKWWSPAWVRASQRFAGYEGEESGDDKTICLSGLPDFKTETTNDPGIPPLWKTKWQKEGRLEKEEKSLDDYFKKTGEKRTVSNYIIKEISDWVREYGIDAFRCDTAKHVDLSVWKELKVQCTAALKEWKEKNPTKKIDDKDFWMTGEVWDHKVGRTDEYDNGFDSLINFDFQGMAGNLDNLDSIYSSYAEKMHSDKFNALSYISSHDTVLFDRDNLIEGGTELMLVLGAAQIYYGDETARPLAFEDCPYKDQAVRGDMNWNSINQKVLKHWQILGRFRRAHVSVGAGVHKKIADSPYTFSRTYDKDGIKDKVVCVIGAKDKTEINVSSVFADGTEVRDAYTGESAKVRSGKVKFKANENGVILLEEAK